MSPSLTALALHETKHRTARIAIPLPDVQLIVRLGGVARNGLDAHAFGIQSTVHRKTIPAGQRSVVVHIDPAASAAVFGVPASDLAGEIVELEALWDKDSLRALYERLSSARSTAQAAAIIQHAVAQRLATANTPIAVSPLVEEGRALLVDRSVQTVAAELGVSERHFRRVFREAVGVSPKAFAKLARFRRAIATAKTDRTTSWAAIAADAGYYDQAHLIDDFRSIAGVTPRAFLAELQ